MLWLNDMLSLALKWRWPSTASDRTVALHTSPASPVSLDGGGAHPLTTMASSPFVTCLVEILNVQNFSTWRRHLPMVFFPYACFFFLHVLLLTLTMIWMVSLFQEPRLYSGKEGCVVQWYVTIMIFKLFTFVHFLE